MSLGRSGRLALWRISRPNATLMTVEMNSPRTVRLEGALRSVSERRGEQLHGVWRRLAPGVALAEL
jgi:hypothetical protein